MFGSLRLQAEVDAQLDSDQRSANGRADNSQEGKTDSAQDGRDDLCMGFRESNELDGGQGDT